MIVISVLLVLGAGVLLGLGLVHLDEPLLYSSIGVSALAALALVVGVRRLAAVRAGQGLITVRPAGATFRLGFPTVRSAPRASGRAAARPVGRATPRPVGRAAVRPPVANIDAIVVDEQPEPPAETLSEQDAARLAELDVEVMVVDGLPRLHVADCPSLDDDEAEAVPVAEALDLGFTPCGLCRPGSALLPGVDGQ